MFWCYSLHKRSLIVSVLYNRTILLFLIFPTPHVWILRPQMFSVYNGLLIAVPTLSRVGCCRMMQAVIRIHTSTQSLRRITPRELGIQHCAQFGLTHNYCSLRFSTCYWFCFILTCSSVLMEILACCYERPRLKTPVILRKSVASGNCKNDDRG